MFMKLRAQEELQYIKVLSATWNWKQFELISDISFTNTLFIIDRILHSNWKISRLSAYPSLLKFFSV
jgi:hypothetical protein